MNKEPNPFFERISLSKDEISASVHQLTETTLAKATKELKATELRAGAWMEALLPHLPPEDVRPGPPPGTRIIQDLAGLNFREMRAILADYDAGLKRFVFEKVDDSLRVIGPPFDAKWNSVFNPGDTNTYADEKTGEFGIEQPYLGNLATIAGVGFYIRATKRNLVRISAYLPINYSWWYLARGAGSFLSMKGSIEVTVHDVTDGGHSWVTSSQEGIIYKVQHTNPGQDQELYGQAYLANTEAAYTYAVLEPGRVYQIGFTCSCRNIFIPAPESSVKTHGDSKIACRLMFATLTPIQV